MPKTLRFHGPVVCFFVILTGIFFRQYLFGGLLPIQFNLLPSFYNPWQYETWTGYEHGVPNKPIGTDNPKLFYPYRKFTTDELKARRAPLWNPYVFSGNVHAATYQAAAWYPLSIVYFLLPQADAWSILIILQPILLGWFTFLFARSQGLSGRASLFGAAVFAFSGWMIAWWEESIVIVHSILWLPFALWAVASKRWLFLVLALSMSIFAGFLQMSIYLFATVIIWSIFSRQMNRYLLLAFFSAFLVTGIQWMPALEAYTFSPRGTVAATFLFDQYLVPFRHLVTLVAPDFWGNPGSYNYFFPKLFYHEKAIWIGLFPLIFAALGAGYWNNSRIRFWIVFTLVSLSLGFALPTSWIWYILKIPVLSAALPARIFVLFSFGASVLAAYGMDAWLRGEVTRKRIGIWLAIISTIIGGLLLFVWWSRWRLGHDATLTNDSIELYKRYATISFRNLIIPGFFTAIAWIALMVRFRTSLCYVVILVSSVLWSVYQADKFLYFSDRRFEFPQTAPIAKLQELTKDNYARVWGYGDATLTPNMLSYYRLFSPEGYDALFSRDYGELLHTIKTGGSKSSQIDRTDAMLKGLTEGDSMDQSPVRLQLMKLLGVRYVLEYKKALKKESLSSEKRFPPSLFSVAWENDTWRIWEYINAKPRAWFEGDGNVAIRRYEPMTVELSVTATTEGTVVLSDTYYPGWIALVDGNAASVERVYDVLRGIRVAPGEHTIVFQYKPELFRWGVILSVAGLMLSVVWMRRAKVA